MAAQAGTLRLRSNLSTLLAQAKRVVLRAHSKGFRDTVRRVTLQLYSAWRERRLGIDTGSRIPWNGCWDAMGYRTLDRAMKAIRIQPGADVMLDLGCGNGRPLIVGATHPFQRMMGVEISEAHCQRARENVTQAARRGRLRCPTVEVFHADAQSFRVPDDVTVAFLFNPFNGEVLDAAIDQLRESLLCRPRPLRILYVVPFHVHDRFAECPWLHRTLDCESEGMWLRIYEAFPVSR